MITGSCLCGQVSYQMDESKSGSAFHCHCSDCKKVTGSGKATVVEVLEKDIEISGNFQTFEKLGSDGSHVKRAFCPICGSQLFTFVLENEGALFVKAGTMDYSDWVRPVATCWAASASPWSPADETTKTFAGNPVSA